MPHTHSRKNPCKRTQSHVSRIIRSAIHQPSKNNPHEKKSSLKIFQAPPFYWTAESVCVSIFTLYGLMIASIRRHFPTKTRFVCVCARLNKSDTSGWPVWTCFTSLVPSMHSIAPSLFHRNGNKNQHSAEYEDAASICQQLECCTANVFGMLQPDKIH